MGADSHDMSRERWSSSTRSAATRYAVFEQLRQVRFEGVVSKQPGIILGEASRPRDGRHTTGREGCTSPAANGPSASATALQSDQAGVAMKSMPINWPARRSIVRAP